MLYSIVPPLVAILSVIGIILFLAKKIPAMNKLEDAERLVANRNVSGVSREDNSGASSKVGQFFLAILEKMIRRVRLLFSKSENTFKLLGEWIRRKRNNKPGEKTGEIVFKENEHLDGISEKSERPAPERKELIEKMFLRRKSYQQEDEEKFFRPIISDRMVVPKRRREVKSRLEELLIERIASNPKDIEAYERLGEYYLEIKNLEHAKECFKQILRLNPMNSNIKYKMRKLERMLKG